MANKHKMWFSILFCIFSPTVLPLNTDLLIGDPWSSVEYKDCDPLTQARENVAIQFLFFPVAFFILTIGSTAYLSELTISGCTSQPCSFTRGQEYTVQLSAIYQSEQSATLPFTITAWKQFIFWFGTDLVKGDACDYLTEGKCPLKFGDQFGVGITLTLPNSLPSISGLVEAQLQNDQGDTILCGDLDVIVA